MRLLHAMTVAKGVDAEHEVERSKQPLGRSAACGGEIEAEVLIARHMKARMVAFSFREKRLRFPSRRVDQRFRKVGSVGLCDGNPLVLQPREQADEVHSRATPELQESKRCAGRTQAGG